MVLDKLGLSIFIEMQKELDAISEEAGLHNRPVTKTTIIDKVAGVLEAGVLSVSKYVLSGLQAMYWLKHAYKGDLGE